MIFEGERDIQETLWKKHATNRKTSKITHFAETVSSDKHKASGNYPQTFQGNVISPNFKEAESFLIEI